MTKTTLTINCHNDSEINVFFELFITFIDTDNSVKCEEWEMR